MTIKPDTIYKYCYCGSIYLTRTELEPDENGHLWALDFQRLSGSVSMMDWRWEFERLHTQGNTFDILEEWSRETHSEEYI